MTCPSCGTENRAGRKFCVECGAALALKCPACGSPHEAGEKFCGECGGALVARPEPALSPGEAPSRRAHAADNAEARKVVTIIFADLIGSTSLHERLDPESVTRLMERYYRAMRGAVEAHGGTVVKLMGDGVMAVFGVPRVAEDDAIRAVRAGVAMQDAFRDLARKEFAAVGAIGLRVGINTGEVVVSADNTDVVGDPVNVAARLQTEAHDGEVVIGESTRRLVAALVMLAPLGSFALKGRAEAMKAYRVESLDRPVGTTTAVFVGRDEELARINAVYEAALATPAARLAVLLGSPGLGKSRLIEEITRRLGDTASVVTAHCDAAGGATFAPVAAALREFLAADWSSRQQSLDTAPEGTGPFRDERENDPHTTDSQPTDSQPFAPSSRPLLAAYRGVPAAQASPLPAQGDALGSGLAALAGLSAENSAESPQPQRGGQPTARGNAPGGGGAAENLRAALEAAVPGTHAERTRIINGITALLAGSPASPEETFFVIRRLLAGLAAATPVVLVIDDLHWAEPLLLDLVEHLVQWGTGVPLLVLVGARPELRDVRSSLVTPGGLVSDVVTLSGLDAGAAMRLAANVIGAADLPAAVAAKVLATSEGNPLFVGELVRMLVDEGALERQGERWIIGANLAALEMPPTIHALLAARIERLRPEERTVLERAAVVGRHFSRSAVAALLGRNGSELDARLEALRRTELIERDAGWFLGEPVLRFHHVLIRDAAYRRLLKGTRAELHEHLADWIEAQVKNAPEHDETIGWHLEQAHQHRRELGPLDAQGKALGERAAVRLAAAGRRALARDDLPVAAGLLGRAIDRLDSDDSSRADLALDWCEALLAAGDVGTAAKAIEELGRLINAPLDTPPKEGGYSGRTVASSDTEQSHRSSRVGPVSSGAVSRDRLHAWHTCFTGQLIVLTAPQALHTTADTVAAAAEELAKLGDAAGEAKGHFVYALALARLGKVGACEAALDRALAAARRAGDRRRANTVLAIAPLAALWGPSPVTRASGRCLDVVRVLRITQGAPAVEAVALSCQGVLEALRGRTDAARRMIASSRKMVEELGIAHRLFEADVFAGRIEAMEGDAATAERLLRGAYEGLRDLGLGIDAARAGALLARTLLAQERIAEAEALSHESERLAGDDLQAAIAWRGVRAEALAKRGAHAAAVELAKAAVAIAAATDALLDHADARLALAAALRSAGRAAEADAEVRRAIELWDTKGATVLDERARSDGGRAAPVAVPGAAPIAAPPAVRRRVRPNAVTAFWARFDAVFAAGDADAIDASFSDSFAEIDHTTGAGYGRDGALASIHRLMRSPGAAFRHEALATLGSSLGLVRGLISASGTGGGRFDVGAYEIEEIKVTEVDEQARLRSAEVFAADRLGDAIARLYERYADLLPEGAARARAAARARTAALLGEPTPDPDRMAPILAPDAEYIDHNQLGYPAIRGADAMLRNYRVLLELTSDVRRRVIDIVALTPEAILLHRLTSGTLRASGGAFENRFLSLEVVTPDGLITHVEEFSADGVEEALARFDALTANARHAGNLQAGIQEGGVDSRQKIAGMTQRAQPVIGRGVRPNAATRNFERFEAAIAARDGNQLAQVFGEPLQVVHHPTGATYGRREMLGTWRSAFRAERLARRQEILATLGDALALGRHWVSIQGLVDAGFTAFGPAELEEIALIEVDDLGRSRRIEIFAADRLHHAIVRLYERYAELLPDSSARERAAATARSVAVWSGPIDVDRLAAAMAPSVENADHRIFGTWSARGAEEYLRHWRLQDELAAGWALRDDALLALEANAFLVRRAYFGTVRSTGGAFENLLLALFVFGPDGLVTRTEVWEPDREAEALARFEELGGGEGKGAAAKASEPFANAASRSMERMTRCWAARDWEGVLALLSPALRMDDRRRMMRLEIGFEAFVVQFRMLFDQPASSWNEPLLATRGERLSLHRTTFRAEVEGGGGPLAFDDHLSLAESDADGRCIAVVAFDLDDIDAAYAELDTRFETGEAAAQGPSWESMRGFVRAVASRDWHSVAALCAESLVEYDHRRLAVIGTTRGAQAWAQNFRTLADLSPDTVYRVHDFQPGPRGFYVHGGWHGTREGGPYEIPLNAVLELDARGRIVRADIYDDDGVEAALARFAELAPAVAAPPRFVNAATATTDPVIACMVAHDWQGFEQLFAENFRMSDRRRVVQLEFDRDQYVAFIREVADGRAVRGDSQVLATRGDRLALNRSTFEFTDTDVGPSEIAFLILTQVDDRGRIVAYVRWDPDDVDAAYAELDARWAAGEALAHPLASKWLAGYLRAFTARDWNAMAALMAPDLVSHSHRLVSWGTLHGPPALVSTMQAQMELAPDTQVRVDHVQTCAGGMLLEFAWHGMREGGAFENILIDAVEIDALGRARRVDVWEAEQLEQARVRFEELRPDPLRIPLNAAARAYDRWYETVKAGNWDALDALYGAAYVFDDRRHMFRGTHGREGGITNTRFLFEGGWQPVRTLLATAGERLALQRIVWTTGEAGAASEIEVLELGELDGEGRFVRVVLFDPSDRAAASAELFERWVARRGDAIPAGLIEYMRAWNDHDPERLRAATPDDFVIYDRRRTGIGRFDRDGNIASLAALWELSRDVRIEPLYEVAAAPHGLLVVNRWFGTNGEGGDFETVYVALVHARGEQFAGLELFEIDDLEAAKARFEELCATRTT